MNKKGSVLDNLGIIVGTFIFVIIMLLFVVLLRQYGNNVTIAGDARASAVFNSGFWIFTTLGDNLVLMVWVGLTIVAVISAILSRAHIVFLFLSVIVTMITVLLSVVFSNAYETFANQQALQSAVGFYPKANFFLLHLPSISVAIAFLVGICLYVQFRRGQSGF